MDTVIASVEKTNRLVTIEEGWPICSIGSEIAAQVQRHAFDALDAPIEAVTGADVPMPYAVNLEKLALPQLEHIIAAAKRAAIFKTLPNDANRVNASPLARHMAEQAGLNLLEITPSGPMDVSLSAILKRRKKPVAPPIRLPRHHRNHRRTVPHCIAALCRPCRMRALITGPTNMMNCLWI